MLFILLIILVIIQYYTVYNVLEFNRIHRNLKLQLFNLYPLFQGIKSIMTLDSKAVSYYASSLNREQGLRLFPSVIFGNIQ